MLTPCIEHARVLTQETNCRDGSIQSCKYSFLRTNKMQTFVDLTVGRAWIDEKHEDGVEEGAGRFTETLAASAIAAATILRVVGHFRFVKREFP